MLETCHKLDDVTAAIIQVKSLSKLTPIDQCPHVSRDCIIVFIHLRRVGICSCSHAETETVAEREREREREREN